jgi:Transposase DDE domain/Domain of unknown function (DUF4372)
MIHTHQPTIFNQIFSLIKHQSKSLIGQLNHKWRVFDYESLLKVLLFAQITGRNSLRDIETWLQADEQKVYHMGLQSIARSTISYWNNKVDSSIYERLFYTVYNQYKWVFWKSIDLWITCVAMDSTLISLVLSMYDWAKYRTTKWWIRLHIGLDISECLPRFCLITDGKKWDNIVAKQAIQENRLHKWEMIIFDRYYVDFKLWKMIDDKESFFVTRTKKNTDYVAIEHYEKKWVGITYDTKVELCWIWAHKRYDKALRVVRFYDIKEQKEYEYITNNFDLSAEQIANIYKHRWSIETFFRRIKQNLKIKSFLWTTENAVKNQIWIALIYYVLLRYLIESINLWKAQALKLCRLVAQKCMERIVISELYTICRSKTSRCLTFEQHPPNSLFS